MLAQILTWISLLYRMSVRIRWQRKWKLIQVLRYLNCYSEFCFVALWKVSLSSGVAQLLLLFYRSYSTLLGRVDVDSVTLQFGKQFQVFPTRPTCCRCEVLRFLAQVRCASQFKNLTANDVWYESVWIAVWQLASSLTNFVSIAKIMLAPLAVLASLSVSWAIEFITISHCPSPHTIQVLTLL